MENLLDTTPYFSIPDNVLVSLYRVHGIPNYETRPGKTCRYEGFFYCLSSKPDPERLLAKASNCEITLMVLHQIGEVGEVLRYGNTRKRFDETGYVFKVGNIVDL